MRARMKVVMAILLLVMMFTGCSVDSASESSGAENVDSSSSTDPVAHIVVTFQTLDSSKTEDLDDVVKEINNITIPEIGVEVELRLINAVDAFTEYSLWISQGETIDLMIMNYQDVTAYINRGMLNPIDELLEEYAPDIGAVMKDGYSLTEASIVDGKAYGVTTVQDVLGSGSGIWVGNSILKESGITVDADHIYSLDELGTMFQTWKKLYPDRYPLGQITSGNTYSTFVYFNESMNSLGTDTNYGILKDGKVVNFYETEEYYQFLSYLRQWYLDGYIYPDAAFTDSSVYELTKLGDVLSVPLSSQPGIITKDTFGEMVTCIKTGAVRSSGQYAKSGFWTIPVTSKNPEAAMKFLNMMYGDTRIGNLLKWGIEGVHYIKMKDEDRRIEYPVGVDTQNVGFLNPMSLYGDYRKIATMDSEELMKQKEEYNETIIKSDEETRDFVYSDVNEKANMAKVDKVVQRYIAVLESGSVDLDTYYPEFLDELDKAGIQEIIADKQTQYDAWLTKQ